MRILKHQRKNYQKSSSLLLGRYYCVKSWDIAQKIYRVKKILYAKDLVVLSKSPGNRWHYMELTVRLKALRLCWNGSLVKLIFSRVCKSYFPSTCWPNRITVKYFLLVTHKSVGGDGAQWEFGDVLNSDLLFASWRTVFSGLVTPAAFPGCGNGNQEMSAVGCFALSPSWASTAQCDLRHTKKPGVRAKFQKCLVMCYLLEAEKLFAKADSPISLLGGWSLLHCMKQGLYLFQS